MKKIKILSVVGAWPQFIKAAAVSRAIIEYNKQSEGTIIEKIVHTGQHYDGNMSKVFFDELKIPRPAVNLEVGSGPHGRQTGLILERLENVLIKEQPDWVLIYGDTNSTLAGALAAAKLHIPVAHVEAGLRSFNREMPEEINRVLADHLSVLLFCPTDTAVKNLRTEGLTDGVHRVGDVMYDSVLFNSQLAEQSSDVMKLLRLDEKSYYLATIHRAENTDEKLRLDGIISAFEKIETPIVLPLHPRTKKTLGAGLRKLGSSIRIIEPVAYLDMLILERNARLILTDSGGVQKEAYWFNVPCITLRDETEWVELVEAGCNEIVGAESAKIVSAVGRAEERINKQSESDLDELYGDGHSSEKIVNILCRSC
jgi:UDP-N-acetylglucosamine 2-epimerase